MDARHRRMIRDEVFQRDNFMCVFCKAPAEDAHHLLERALWRPNDGYLVDNLISVCSPCHFMCERTQRSVEEGREAAGITNVIVPAHLYDDQKYDKWGNPILDDGRRLRGELMDNPRLQRMLWNVEFANYIKYPRTYHLPWSNPNRDDKSLHTASMFNGKDVVVTEKMDGECTTMYHDFIHARSVDGSSHTSQSLVRNFWSKNVAWTIPEAMRICGENMYAQHSIPYTNLTSYFYGFGIWEYLTCLSWDDTIEWFGLIGITSVPVLFRGKWEDFDHKEAVGDTNTREGYVVRLAGSFQYRDFPTSVAKFVRPNHLQTPERWSHMVIPNKLKESIHGQGLVQV